MRDTRNSYQWDAQFDVDAELAEVARLAGVRRRHRFTRSAVDRYRGELGALYAAGLSFAQLSLWLWRRKRVRVARSTLHRRMSRWPEVTIRGRHGQL
jgi:hypothetical protein